jgi:hypothetical protein
LLKPQNRNQLLTQAGETIVFEPRNVKLPNKEAVSAQYQGDQKNENDLQSRADAEVVDA